MVARPISNDEVADALERVAALLQAQDAEPFRVRAYRNGAATCRTLDRPLREILDREGKKGLDELPAIGRSLASAIAELLHTGRLMMLERLEGQVAPEDLLATVPTIGEELAHRIHDRLGVDTLEELELAAHDGRLEALPGFGPRRVEAIRTAVGALLDRAGRRRARAARPGVLRARDGAADVGSDARGPDRPSVETILAVDAEYRRRAAADDLRRIRPRRFNPSGEAWLPILHVARDGWSLTAHYSNSANAHRLGRTRDWVVVLAERNGQEDRATVVTEHRGPMRGERVVRGREVECAATRTRPRAQEAPTNTPEGDVNPARQAAATTLCRKTPSPRPISREATSPPPNRRR